jgi:Chromate transport protein ChrA
MNIIFELFITFLKIGLFTIGGGYAMIPMIKSEVVSKGFMTLIDLMDFLAVSEMTPGAYAIDVSTFVGIKIGGFLGAVAATLGVVIPSFVIVLIVAKYFEKLKDNKIIKGAVTGLRPIVIGLIITSMLLIAKESFLINIEILSVTDFFKNNISFVSIIIFTTVFFLYKKYKLYPVLIVIISAAMGILLKGILPLIGIKIN